MNRMFHRVRFCCWGIFMFFVWRKRLGYWDYEAALAAMSMPFNGHK